MNGLLASLTKFSSFALILGAAYSATASAEDYQPIDAKVVDIQYAGGQSFFVRWETYNWVDDNYNDPRSSVVSPSKGPFKEKYIYRRHSLFAREIGGEYFLVKDLGSTTDRTWSGQIPQLNEYNPLQFQVREQHVDTGAYSSGEQAPGKIIDLSNIDLPPSFEHKGDQLDLSFEPQSGVVNLFEVDDWASNYSDGGDNSQEVFVEKLYMLQKGIEGYLFDTNPNQLFGAYATRDTPADGFVVFQACDVSRYTTRGWMGACGEEVPVILRSEPTPEHANFPSFDMGHEIAVGEDYDLQEFPNWVSNIVAGENAINPFLLFHTIWVTNSSLFEMGPYISLPSGTLRFKFKEGASGTAKMYVALADWSQYSPDNISSGVSTRDIYTLDISPDHSSIQTIELSVGSNTQQKSTSNGARGSDMQGIPAVDEVSLNGGGGGGSMGLAMLSLALFPLRRRKFKQ